jgi:hypothetical protein
VNANQIAFPQGHYGLEGKFRELRVHDVIDVSELRRAVKVFSAFVKNARFGEELLDGLAAALRPDLVEKAKQESCVLFPSGRRCIGRHV